MSLADKHIFNFKTDISSMKFLESLNNPFSNSIPQIAQIASQEFQEYIHESARKWKYNFETQKGKMFGVLVIQKEDYNYGYLGTVSGNLFGTDPAHFVSAVLDKGINNVILSDGLKKLAIINQTIKHSQSSELVILKEKRKAHSKELQNKLFEETRFLNSKGEIKNVIDIFQQGNYGYPPAAAGECAAPKLLQFAFQHKLKPIAIAEFWWGHATKNNERLHKNYYPACKSKCRPILEFMLNNRNLFANTYKD